MKIVLVGGSGFIGQGLRSRLVGLGHEVSIIGRGPNERHDGWAHVHWDALTLGDWMSSIDGADVLVHLTGKRVDCRPTRRNIDELIASRVGPVELVGRAIQEVSLRPKAWVQLSSLAIFGDSGSTVVDESSIPPTHGIRQQVEVCRLWEDAFATASTGIARRVLVRPAIGIGGRDDPASAQLSLLARFCLGGAVAGGKQWVSWISTPDLMAILEKAILDSSYEGLVHATAPQPTTNDGLMAEYRRLVGRRRGLPTPRFAVELGARLLGSDPQLVLSGRRCVPTRLIDEGFEFSYPTISSAVQSLANTGS